MRNIRIGFGIILLFTLLLVPMGSAMAHAELVRSIPRAGENLSHSPAGVEIFMSEAVESKLSEISIYNSSGIQIDNKNTRLDPADNTHLLVSLPSLPNGIYTVYWKTASVDDGHPTGGAFAFSVGSGFAANMESTQSSNDSVSTTQMLFKGMLYLAVALLTGGVIFYLAAWRPSIQSAHFPASLISFRTIWIGALILTGMATLVVLASESNGLIDASLISSFFTILLSTRAGLLAMTRLAILFILVGLLVPPENKWNRLASLPAALLLLLTIGLLSHAAAQSPALLAVTLDLVHLTAACAWAGGLGFFLVGLFWLRRTVDNPLLAVPRARLVTMLLERFSSIALTSAGVLVLTGIYEAWLDIGSLNNLVDTLYGQALLLKLALAFGMILLGGLNHFIHRPRLEKLTQEGNEADRLGALQRFRLSLSLETFLSAVLLIWVGIFTSLPPAQPPRPEIVRTASAADGEFNLRLMINPGKVGLNTFTLKVSPKVAAANDASGASLIIFSSNDSLPPNEIQLDPSGNQTYSGEAYALGYPDRWQIRIVVSRSDHLPARADVNVDLRQQPGLSQQVISGLLIACLVGALLFAIWEIFRGNRTRHWQYSG